MRGGMDPKTARTYVRGGKLPSELVARRTRTRPRALARARSDARAFHQPSEARTLFGTLWLVQQGIVTPRVALRASWLARAVALIAPAQDAGDETHRRELTSREEGHRARGKAQRGSHRHVSEAVPTPARVLDGRLSNRRGAGAVRGRGSEDPPGAALGNSRDSKSAGPRSQPGGQYVTFAAEAAHEHPFEALPAGQALA